MVPKASKIVPKTSQIWRKTDCSHQSESNTKISQLLSRDSVTFGLILGSKIDEMNNKNWCQKEHVFQSHFLMVWTSFLRCFFKIFWEKISSISEKVKNRKTLQNTGHASKNQGSTGTKFMKNRSEITKQYNKFEASILDNFFHIFSSIWEAKIHPKPS